MTDKVVPNNSHVKGKKTEVEDHPRNSIISNKIKFVTACNDSLKSRTSNVNVVCATYGKCLIDLNHFACVTELLHDVNARTKKPNVVPISTRKLKSQAKKSVATPHQKTVASETTTRKSKSYYRMFHEKTSMEMVDRTKIPIRVYYVEGLNHNLFSVGQFFDAYLEVAFRKSTCFVRDLQRNDLLTGIEHQTSTPRTPEQNDAVERRNRTLVEVARTMLSASKLLLFFWAEAIATACYTQNRSIIILTHEKMAYHIINDRKPSIKHLHIFGCICYITRDGENSDQMKEKGDLCIRVGYSTQSKGYRVYNKRTRLIVESIHIRCDEIKEMFETFVANDTSGLIPQRQKVSDYDNSDTVPQMQNVLPLADATVPS
uniref:Integrase catalytic domain-containing protein n=1 Tax=Tanacetum cinerariifolium TaxID=118510 RepID=A0A699JAD0_TANCI|nr:hypothetical protein [Tanacetum cinerariifolium]